MPSHLPALVMEQKDRTSCLPGWLYKFNESMHVKCSSWLVAKKVLSTTLCCTNAHVNEREAGKSQAWGSWGHLEALPGPLGCSTLTPAPLPAPHSQETCSPPLVTSILHPSRMNSSTWSSSPRPTSGECDLGVLPSKGQPASLFLLILSRT